jgi:hypothetical protein
MARSRWVRIAATAVPLLVGAAALGGLASADEVWADGDGVLPANNVRLDFGDVCRGSTVTRQIPIVVRRATTGGTSATFANSANVLVSVSTVVGPGLDAAMNAGDRTIVLPSTWTGMRTGTFSTDVEASGGSGSATATVVYSPTATGPFSGAVVFSGTGQNAAGGQATRTDTMQVTATVVDCPVVQSDTTPPTITPTLAGPLGRDGWYIGDVSVSWALSDRESAVTGSTGCTTTAVETDTAGRAVTCTATSAGGQATRTVTVTRDATPPTIAALLAPPEPDGANDWYVTTPTVSFTCADALSGIDSDGCPAPHTLGEGSDQAHTAAVADVAGNRAGAGVEGVDVDLTAPAITWAGGPEAGVSYVFGQVPPAPTCTAVDGLSGPGSCAVIGYSAAVGAAAMTATATDTAGNRHTEIRSYRVLPWSLRGYFRPLEMGGAWNRARNGSTVPLKFEVFAGATELTATASVASFAVRGVACPRTGVLVDGVALRTTGGTSLRYDATAGQFVQNWQAPRMPGACYTVTVTTLDGSTLSANLELT